MRQVIDICDSCDADAGTYYVDASSESPRPRFTLGSWILCEPCIDKATAALVAPESDNSDTLAATGGTEGGSV